jgi:Holliday junction resolvase RusA-like endonuclease
MTVGLQLLLQLGDSLLGLTFGDKRNQDIDNRIKSALDALALALGFDDNCIDRIVIERAGYARGCPRCELILEAL